MDVDVKVDADEEEVESQLERHGLTVRARTPSASAVAWSTLSSFFESEETDSTLVAGVIVPAVEEVVVGKYPDPRSPPALFPLIPAPVPVPAERIPDDCRRERIKLASDVSDFEDVSDADEERERERPSVEVVVARCGTSSSSGVRTNWTTPWLLSFGMTPCRSPSFYAHID
jgi:hypothetical protein